MIMDDKLKALQEGNQEVSPVLSEGQSPETTEQDGVTPKSTDVCVCKTDTAQNCDNSPTPLASAQTHRPVSIVNIIILDEDSIVITLRISNHFTKKTKDVEVRYDTLSAETLKQCVTKCGGVSTDWKDLYNLLMNDLKMYELNKSIKIMYGHTKLGWIKTTDGMVFNHQQSISSNNQSSEYMGKVDIKPKGSLDHIIKMIQEWILSTPDWSPLEATIAFSVASVVLPFAKCAWGKTLNNLILHLTGDSTTGKSTSLRLYTGLASNPFNEKSGFWLNHQSSLPALIRRIGHNQGFPVSIDELSSGSKKEYTDFVYSFGNGEEKDRLKAGGTALCDSANFSTVVLSSGEVSILDKCSANTGIRARCVEFCNVEWTDSKAQADAVYDCLRHNYGWVAPLVAKELLNNSDKWKARWDEIYDQIKRQMDEDQIRLTVEQRLSEFVVLFTLAAEIANEALSINLNVDEIRNFCYLHVITVNADAANLRERAYEYLLRYVGRNLEKFPYEDRCLTYLDTYYSKEDISGFIRRAYRSRSINGKEYPWQIVFWRDVFEEILRKGGFSPVVVSHKLRDARFLQVKDKRRCTCEITYNQVPMKCYVLYYIQEEEMIFETMQGETQNPLDEDDYEE